MPKRGGIILFAFCEGVNGRLDKRSRAELLPTARYRAAHVSEAYLFSVKYLIILKPPVGLTP